MADALLIIEDDDDIRTDLVEIPAHNGYRVVPFSNGAEALAYLKSYPPPRLILLDLMMPVRDGWEVMRMMRAIPALAHVPVIVVSGAGKPDAGRAAAGAIACISKPFKVRALLDAIERYALPAG